MPDYQKGKIYKIINYEDDDIYIGSTCETLSKRMTKHRDDLKRYKQGKTNYITSFQILEKPSAKIVLIENYPCDSREELTMREQYHIKSNACVNKVIPGRSIKEYREDNKDKIKAQQKAYNEANADKIKSYKKEYGKAYREANADKIKEYREADKEKNKAIKQAYYQANKEKRKAQNKAYREANADKIKAYREANADRMKAYNKAYYKATKLTKDKEATVN
jgi:hypothetical protein